MDNIVNTVLAKPQYLKSVDYVIGLVKRLDSEGKRLSKSISNGEILVRLAEMREKAQQGLDMSDLPRNVESLVEAGKRILSNVEKHEKHMPDAKYFAEFAKPYQNKTQSGITRQATELEKIISKALSIPRSSVSKHILESQRGMSEAYAAILPTLESYHQSIVSDAKDLGDVQSRIKDPKSCWGKQFRQGEKPFIYFKDLIGTRITGVDAREAAVIATEVQQKFDVMEKKNYFLDNSRYNAINYTLSKDWMVFELQVKTASSQFEGSIDHSLIYAPEKSITRLSEREREMVATVVAVSTLLSMREWNEAFRVPIKITKKVADRFQGLF